LKITDLKGSVRLRFEAKFIPEDGGRRMEDAVILHDLLPDEAMSIFELVTGQLKKYAPERIKEQLGEVP